jgi:hypothetical protein
MRHLEAFGQTLYPVPMYTPCKILDRFCLLLKGFVVVDAFLLCPTRREVGLKDFSCSHVKLEPTQRLEKYIIHF